jgi:hypothetical protein
VHHLRTSPRRPVADPHDGAPAAPGTTARQHSPRHLAVRPAARPAARPAVHPAVRIAVSALAAAGALVACTSGDDGPGASPTATTSATSSPTPTSDPTTPAPTATSSAPAPTDPPTAPAEPPATPPPAGPASPPPVAEPVHGGTAWGVYLAVMTSPDDPAYVQSGTRLEQFGYFPSEGDVSCDEGAAEALGLEPNVLVRSVHFDSREDAEAFVALYGDDILGIAQVTTYCLD